ncbi:MAG TPA: PqqD family protein [Promineifilum sp.]|nr:PqqD family protein [Promineifilum sp.]HRO23530.1 PqqD family protein [Promineifilum sp.]HRO89827.1 PqqD family protein [Promineifilum sp.]HRQ14648.1 PqqD family protein [Promineifilum sp.]
MADLFPKARHNIEAKEIGDETLLISGDDIHVLNETAAFIWKLCDGTCDPAAIEAALREEYDVPSDRDVAIDVARALADFRSKGLLDA